MPKMKSHSGLKKRVKQTKSGKVKRNKKGSTRSAYVEQADMAAVKKGLLK